MPPKGMRGSEITIPFTKTIPGLLISEVKKLLLLCVARPDALSPGRKCCHWLIQLLSSLFLTRMIAATGPKHFFAKSRDSRGTSTSTVGS